MKVNKLGKGLVIFISVAITILWLCPYLYLASSAFKPGREVIEIPARFFPSKFSLQNFQNLFSQLSVAKDILNSLLTATCSMLIAVLLGSLAAYAIARSGGTKLSAILIAMVLCIKMIPISSITVPIYNMICRMGLYDKQIALIIVYSAINIPFVIWMMINFYESIPITLDEAAFIDGASNLQTFTKIILPLSVPGLATAAIFTFFMAWNDFLVALLMTSVNAQTFTVGLSGFLSAYSLDLGPMCAGSFLFSFPVIILSIFAQKFIVRGMTSGAVKG